MMTYSHARDEYLETEVLTAGPVRRVQMLYEALVDAVAIAKNAQAAGDIATRAHQVNRATSILTELAVSLDHSQGGKLTKELVELYDYSIRRLLEGSMAKKVEPFAEVERLMQTLLDGWRALPEVDSRGACPVTGESSVSRFQMGFDEDLGERHGVGLVGSGINQVG
jgi:flagellar secretion chaperone FliS